MIKKDQKSNKRKDHMVRVVSTSNAAGNDCKIRVYKQFLNFKNVYIFKICVQKNLKSSQKACKIRNVIPEKVVTFFFLINKNVKFN